MPIADSGRGRHDSGFAPARIYRKVSRGAAPGRLLPRHAHLQGPQHRGPRARRTHILGQEQVDWLIREVSRSRATWKVIAADLPLGIVVPDGPVNEESLSNRDPGAPLGKELEIAGRALGVQAATVSPMSCG